MIITQENKIQIAAIYSKMQPQENANTLTPRAMYLIKRYSDLFTP